MIQFKSKEEELFWKQLVVAYASDSYKAEHCGLADNAIKSLRARMPDGWGKGINQGPMR